MRNNLVGLLYKNKEAISVFSEIQRHGRVADADGVREIRVITSVVLKITSYTQGCAVRRNTRLDQTTSFGSVLNNIADFDQ